MVTDFFFFLKPVATSIQIAIPVYLEPKKEQSLQNSSVFILTWMV